jgi:antitoxin HicB
LTLPTIFGKIGEGRLFVPISGKDMRKLFYDDGYELASGEGKGSHWKLKKKGCPTVIIPNHKELKRGLEHALRKIQRKVTSMKYHFKIHKEGTGFWAQCIELAGCITEADSMDELYNNMREALNLYVEEAEDSKDLACLPNESLLASRNVVTIPLDPQIAFAFMVRYYRIKYGLTQQQAAKKMGFETIYSYQRLETKRCNPSLRIIAKIKQAFPEFSIDYAVSC